MKKKWSNDWSTCDDGIHSFAQTNDSCLVVCQERI